MKVSLKLRAWAKTFFADPNETASVARFGPPVLMPGVVPKAEQIAMDATLADVYKYANLSTGHDTFMGYPLLSELTQRAEYRMLSEKTAQAMCRKWIKLTSKGDGDKSEIIKIVEAALIKFKVRELFREAATYDGFFGRCQIFVDLGLQQGPELEMPLFIHPAKIAKNSLRKFKIIEPIYTYPYKYNASNPLADDYYNPTTWFVMGQQVHSSRLLLFVSRPVPDLLKPAYNFGGLSMTQLARPYVDNWLKTRTSVGKLISNFSTSGIKTNMQNTLMGGTDGTDDGDDIVARAELFAAMRDNQGMMLLDKDTEEFFQSNTPLTTVDKLQAQSQEHMASVSSTPLSILLGITPTGLNASSDGEIRIYYDYVNAMQQLLFGDNLKKVIDIIQLSEIGVIDPDISFEFVSLWQMDTKEMAAVRKSDAEAASLYFEMGAVSGDEVRQRLAADPESGYTGLAIIGAVPMTAEELPDAVPGSVQPALPDVAAAPAV
jgi:hypothetical protein